MSNLHFAAIHGIATGHLARALYPGQWKVWLERNGIDCTVHPVTWRSTGTISFDVSKIVASKKFRESQIELIMDRLEVVRDRVNNDEGKLVVIGHSMGQALGSAALERLAAQPGDGAGWASVPFLAIGGPLGHPVWGRALRGVGLKLKNLNGVHFYNHDDGVTSMFNQYHEDTDNWKHIRVAIAGDGGFVKEHRDKFYLTHPLFVDYIKENFDGNDSH